MPFPWFEAMKLSKKLLMVPLLSFPLIFNSVPDTKVEEHNIKKSQEELFEEKFNVDLNIEGYAKDNLEGIKMMVPRGADSIYMDNDLTLDQKEKILPHEYAHIIQNNIRKELKEKQICKPAYDTSKIYSLFVLEGSAEAAKYLALNQKIKEEGNFKPFENKKSAWLFYGFCPSDFYAEGASLFYPLMKKKGLEKTLVGLFTTDPPTSSDFWTEEKRQDYLKKVENNSEIYSPIILGK